MNGINGVHENSTAHLNTDNLADLPPGERKRYEALWELFYAEVVYLVDHLLVLQNVSIYAFYLFHVHICTCFL